MNVLFISHDGLTDPLGQSQVLPYVEGISRAGHRVVILSIDKPARLKALRHVIDARSKASGIDWYPLSYTNKPPVLATIWDMSKMVRKTEQLHKQYKFDMVHSRCYLPSIAAMRLKQRYGLKYLFDMRGLWADERVDGGLWNLTNPLYRTIYNYFKRREKEFMNEADGIVSLTHNAARYLQEKFHQAVPIDVIPCCADMDLFSRDAVDPAALLALREKLGIGADDFVLTYVGSLGTWYMLDEMMDFFKALVVKKPAARFLIITNDPDSRIHSVAAARGVSESRITVTNATRIAMPLYTALGNATVFFIRPTYSKKASSPVKQGEAMGMGIPIVCNSGIGDSDAIVRENNAGIVIDAFTETQYAQAVDKLLTTTFDAQQIRSSALRHFSLDEGVKRFLQVYDRLQRL